MRNASADFQFKLYDGFSGRSSSSGSALMYGGIGETIAEKSGILNIGMEGVMLSGAFFSFAGAWYSGNLFVGLLCGMAGGLVVSLLHGLLSITLIQNQSVSGLAINMLMLGVTSFFI
mgnify:FL=1